MWKQHKIKRKIDGALEMEKEGMDRNTLLLRLNKIDTEIGQIMKAAEKGCCMVGRQDVHDWSSTQAKIIKKRTKFETKVKKKRQVQHE